MWTNLVLLSTKDSKAFSYNCYFQTIHTPQFPHRMNLLNWNCHSNAFQLQACMEINNSNYYRVFSIQLTANDGNLMDNNFAMEQPILIL